MNDGISHLTKPKISACQTLSDLKFGSFFSFSVLRTIV